MKSEIALCYYPTNVAFVDDNESFLSTLKLFMGEYFSCRVFSDPRKALTYANELYSEEGIGEASDPDQCSDPEQWVKRILNHSNSKRFDDSRSSELSVVVVDYDMPYMNGIQFCEQMKNPTIKKILLTGYATAGDAVRAFNDNIIHYYINKSDENMLEALRDAIQQMQQEYFREVSSYIKSNAVDSSAPYFSDAALATYFERVCSDMGVSEYYFLTHPSRFVLKAHDGKEHTCVIYSEEDLFEHIEILKDEGAPQDMLDSIISFQCVPYFRTKDGYYESDSFLNQNCLYPADKVEGEVNYYCAIIENDEVGEKISEGFHRLFDVNARTMH